VPRRRQKATLYLRIRTANGKQRYCPVIWEVKNRRLLPHWCLMGGVPEHHPEAAYHLRYRVDGRQIWENVGDDPEHAVELRATRVDQLLHPNTRDAKIFAENCKPVPKSDPEASSERRFRLDEEVNTYLTNCQKLSPKTYKSYKLSLTLFQKSCSKVYVDQVKKQDLQAFDSFLLRQENDDRTRANRVTHIVTFLRNREGRREGDPVTDVTIRIKYVEAPPEPYTRQELEQLFRVSTEEEKLLWRFFLGTGFRENEASVAEYRDINLDKKLIFVIEKSCFDFKPKDREKRAVPISDELITNLMTGKNGSTLLFGRGGKPDGHLLRRLKDVAFKGGLNCGRCTGTITGRPVSCAGAPVCRKWILHRFRKNFANDRHEKGASARQIQKWLGHESLETTLRYLASADDTSPGVREIVNSVYAGL
jgi:integrase/recombinase XerD